MKRKPNQRGKSGQAKQNSPPITPPAVIEGDHNAIGQNAQPCCNTVCKYTKDPLHWTNYAEAACAIALVLITGTYTYYARQQAEAAIIAANATKVASDTAASTLVLDQRPWVGLMGANHVRAKIEVGSPIEVSLEFQNVGKTPALNQTSVNRFLMRPIHVPMPEFGGYSRSDAGPTISLMPNAIANVDLITTTPSDHGMTFNKLSVADVAAINTGKVQLFLYGSIWYDDTFSRSHRTDYCLQYLPTNGGGVSNFAACPEHNYAD